MSLDKCKLDLKEKFKGINIDALVDGIDTYFKDVDLQDPKARAAASEFAKKKIIELRADENKRLINAEKSQVNVEHIAQFDNPIEGVESMLYHNNVEHNSKIPNMDRLGQAIEDKHLSVIMRVANKHPGLLNQLKEGSLNKEILVALGGSKNDLELSGQAKDMAKAIRTIHDSMYEQKQGAGFATGYIENYMGRQLHPKKNLQELGFSKWGELADKSYDWDKMGIEKADRAEFLTDMWNKLNDPRNPYGVSDDFTKLQINTGKKIESSRSISFKDGEALGQYYEGLGVNYFENLIRDVEADSKQIAAATRFGPDFNRGFTKSMEQAGIAANAKGPKALDAFNRRRKLIERNFDLMVYGAQNPENGLMAKSGDKARKFQDMTKLTLALPSTVTDFPLSAAVISKQNGKNYLGNHLGIMNEFFKQFKDNTFRRDTAARLQVFAEDVNVFQMRSRLGEEGRITGLFDKAHHMAMQMTGLPRQAVAMRTAIAKMISTDLGDDIGKGWGDLYAGKRDTLKGFGIDEKGWETIRLATDDFGDGTRGITPEAILDLEGVSPQERNRLSLGLSAYLTQMSELGSPTPGIKRQAWKMALDPNTIMGQLARFVGQYKSFALSQLDTMAFIAKNPNKKYGDVKLTAATMAMSTAMGYVALTAKDWAKGRQAKDPTDVKTWADAFIQGGSGLIYSDFMFADYSKSYRSLPKDLMGPAIGGTGADVAELFAATVRTDFSSNTKRAKLIKKAFKTMERNSPTIPFKKAILNKNVHEAFSRGMNGDFSKIDLFKGK